MAVPQFAWYGGNPKSPGTHSAAIQMVLPDATAAE
jgi:hypothetical protein